MACLLNVDGTYKYMPMADVDYREAVGGYITLLPKRQAAATTTAYADDEGLLKDLPSNAWSAFLHDIGYHMEWAYGGVRGPVLLVGSQTKTGADRVLPKKMLEQVKAFYDQEMK